MRFWCQREVSVRPGYWPQHFLNFFPLPHSQGSLRPVLGVARTIGFGPWVFPVVKYQTPSCFLNEDNSLCSFFIPCSVKVAINSTWPSSSPGPPFFVSRISKASHSALSAQSRVLFSS